MLIFGQAKQLCNNYGFTFVIVMGYKDVRSGHQPGLPGQQRVMEGCSKELQQLDEVESLLLELRNSKVQTYMTVQCV